MPANIVVRTDGTAEMMVANGEAPWHSLGQRLDHVATAKEAIEAAHLDWNIVKQPVYVNTPGGFNLVPNKFALMRQDTKEVFNVLSDRYSPVQNREAFAFFDAVVGQGEAIYHTAGALDGGRKVWILAKLPGDLVVANQDVLERYILLANSHDGSQALTMAMTPIRVVCQNTLSVALAGAKRESSFYARHTTNVHLKAGQARDILGLAEAYYQLFAQGVERLASKAWNEAQMKEMLVNLFKLKEYEALEEQHANKRVAFETVLELFETGKGNNLPGVYGTQWAAYNAMTEWSDHSKKVRGVPVGSVEAADRRLNSAWFGSGLALKQQAWDYLMQVN